MRRSVRVKPFTVELRDLRRGACRRPAWSEARRVRSDASIKTVAAHSARDPTGSKTGLHDDNLLERVWQQQHDLAALDAQPFLLFPIAQLLVRALARHPDHVPKLALRDGNPRRLRGRALAQAEQRLRQAH